MSQTTTEAPEVCWSTFLQTRGPWQGVADLKVTAEDLTLHAGGYSAEIWRLHLSSATDATLPPSIILKRTKESRLEMSQQLGIAREALFLADCSSLLKGLNEGKDQLPHWLPKLYYAAEERDGYKIILMEDLSQPARNGAQAGYFFEAHSPINWGKDLSALALNKWPNVTEKDVVLRAFRNAAAFHAEFWLDRARLVDTPRPYLRGAAWMRNEDRESFEASGKQAVDAWIKYQDTVKEAVVSPIHPKMKHLMDHAVATLNFDQYVALRRDRTIPWTLVHGDFHPANMMVAKDPTQEGGFDLVLLDWEAVGVGSGPQELGQFMISHAKPEHRRAMEGDALAAYYEALVQGLTRRGVSAADHPTLAQVTREYVVGGLGRWAWLYPLCATLCPPAATKYFHDQMLSFMEDHNVSEADVGMLRP